MADERRMQKWLDIVDRDIDVAEWLQVGGRWLYVAFECHQALRPSRPTGAAPATTTLPTSTTITGCWSCADSQRR